VSKTELVPIYYDGQDRSQPPAQALSREEIKRRRKAGELDGWYQCNGRLFVIYVPKVKLEDLEREIARGGFDSAWAIRASGETGMLGEFGMLVWQMNTPRRIDQEI